MFLGANIDAVETAASFGIRPDRAVNYKADVIGTACIYEAVSNAVSDFRKNKAIKEDWSEMVEMDYDRRR